MSNNYYFKKWRNVIQRLETVVALDLEYQATKAHEKTLCEQVHNLSGVLGQYMAVYNDGVDCYRQNLQLQKTSYMIEVINAVVSRMLELKHDLQKFENSNLQFFGTGIIQMKLTMYDIEMRHIPKKIERPDAIQTVIEEAMIRAKDIMDTKLYKDTAEDEKITDVTTKPANWWETDEIQDITETVFDLGEQLSEETLKKKEMIALIQAHEKSRQLVTRLKHREVKRQLWEKELKGTLRASAPIELRERSAKLIQKVLRAYFETKRRKLENCKRDELLGLRMCSQDFSVKQDVENNRAKLFVQYSEEWKTNRNVMKQRFLELKCEAIKEDYRDYIRDWFQQWFNEVHYIHSIPKPKEGGLTIILRELLPSPIEWVDEYKNYLEEKKANKNKTAIQKKYEKLEVKREKMMQKKEELMKKKKEAEFLKKLKKNPNLHPGFNYPSSKYTGHVTQAIEHYKKDWDDYDNTNAVETKVKSIKELDWEQTCMEAKLEVLDTIDEDMRKDFKALRTALKKDYQNNNEKLPEDIKRPAKRRKSKRKVRTMVSELIADKIENLAIQGFIQEYPRITFEDFMGDPNFAGEELRCQYKYIPLLRTGLLYLRECIKALAQHADLMRVSRLHTNLKFLYGILRQAFPHHGDIRRVWWEGCREMAHGFRKILLVGPKGSSKTRLVHVMASVNDALLFVIDPKNIPADYLTPVYLQQLVNTIGTCARTVQPSVIYIKHVQRLFYSKVPADEQDLNLELLKRYFTKILFRKIKKTDRVTIIGSCINPWTTKSKRILKQFQSVVLLPHTCYSVVLQLLKEWVSSNSVIPKDINISSLAYMLQGYNFGYLKEALHKFLNAEKIVRIAAYGLSPQEIYDYIIQDDNQSVAEHEKYLKWYTEKTTWGIKEKKHLEEQKEFQELVKKFAEKAKKRKANKSSFKRFHT